ncbi:MAG: hypothetical protein LBU14_03105 [Candidatus Peribacteria bacterium]|nr:hypothetical protein [Candidatus Peribacteria bacterium]
MCELIDILNEKKPLVPAEIFDFKNIKQESFVETKYDFKYVLGQNYAKRALEIAAS